MSIIEISKALLGRKTIEVRLSIKATSDSELAVTALPCTGPVPENASEELKLLVAALSTGIKVTGSPDAIEAELAAHIKKRQPKRDEWEDQVAEIEARLEEAKNKDKAKAATKTPSTSTAKASAAKQEPKPAVIEPVTASTPEATTGAENAEDQLNIFVV